MALGLALTLFVAEGPIVRRVRSLETEVRRSARERYAVPVTVRASDEIAQLAREPNDAAEEVRRPFRAVEDREQALRRFVANTSHMEEVHDMASLIQSLAASSKLEAGELAIELGEVDLNALVERVAARHAPIARQRGVELNLACPEEKVVARGDLTLPEQAVSNLVHNAVQYGEPGGHVALLLDPVSDHEWCVRVVDDGPGIDDDLIERLMERSVRGDEARSRHPDGQGLGLHIALEVARRHGFTLRLRRSEHGGLEAELRGGSSSGS